jgi:acyl carrier protein
MAQISAVEDQLRQFVERQFPLARKNGFTNDTNWLQNGAIDSLGILDLVHFLESEFSVLVSDEELVPENFQSLSSVTDFVSRKIGSKQTPQG